MGGVVQWSDLSADQAEQLIAAWLVRAYPGAQRVDGSGGDGGVDVRLPLADGLHIFEVKSFYSRLNPSRKAQIKNSLATALKTQKGMRRWTLVLPLDLTPSEISWFENTLCAGLTIETDWIGLTALESALNQHRDLLRGMAPGSVERRAMDLMAEYRDETAAMRGVVDGVDRLQRLRDQLDLIDPYWAFDVAEVTPGKTVLTLRPKDPSASPRPIVKNFRLRAEPGSELEAAINNFMIYGRPVDIPAEAIVDVALDLPAGLVADPTARLTAAFGPADTSPTRLRGRLVAKRDNKVIGTLPVDWNDLTQGPAGGQWLAGHDASGFLEVLIQIDPNYQGGVSIKAPASDDVLPGEALSALRFLQQLEVADHVEFQNPGKDPVKARVSGGLADAPNWPTLIAVAAALSRIQEAIGAAFPLPRNWTRQDAEMLYFCDELVHNGSVLWPWPGSTPVIRADEVWQVARLGPLPRINIDGQGADVGRIMLMGHKVDLPGQIMMEIRAAVATNLPGLVKHALSQPAASPTLLHLSPDQQTTCRFYLRDTPAEEPA